MSIRTLRTRMLTSVAVAGALAFSVVAPLPALADHTTAPTKVTIAGSFQKELTCPDDWQPGCAVTDLADDDASGAKDGIWTGTFTIPAGEWK